MDKTITITRSGVRISPYKKGQSKMIENITSTWDPVRHRRDPFNGFFNDVENEFYTYQISLEMLRNNFPDYAIEYEPSYTYRRIEPFEMNSDIVLTDIQSAIMDELIKNNPYSHPRVFINLQTGYGKTVISIARLSSIGLASLIMCYSVKVLKQWYNTLQKMTNINMNRVLIINSSSLINGFLSGEINVDNYDIFLCTPGILTGYADRYGFKQLSEFFRIAGIGIKIYDEAHKNVTNITYLDANSNVLQTIYLSADYSQADPVKRKKYYSIFYNVPIIKPDIKVMDSMKYIDAIVVDYNSKPSQTDVAWVTQTRRGFSIYNYMKYQMDKKVFIEPLKSVLRTILKSENHGKILIILNMIEHVDVLYDLLIDEIDNLGPIGKFHSKIENEEKEKATNCDIIISTVQSFGVGVDIKNIKHVIVLPQLNEIDDNQTAGRARPADGETCRYYMFIDSGFDYCNRKLHRRLSYLQKYKIRKVFRIYY